jgi:hypothetical protein
MTVNLCIIYIVKNELNVHGRNIHGDVNPK